MSETALVIGAGAWGTALAALLARDGAPVLAWTPEKDVAAAITRGHENPKYLPGIRLPEAVRATDEVENGLGEAQVVVWAVPTQALDSVARRISSALSPQALFVSAAKGLEQGSHLRPSQVLERALPGHPLAALLGPSHAEEVARGVPTSVVASATDPEVARRVQALFHGESFRVYANDDLPGSEYATALKNVIAVAAGISDGLGFGDNTKGALVTRGLAEISRLGTALGGRRETFFGLTGVGDLVTTAFSRFSRNRHVGEQVGKGRSLEAVLGEMTQVAEGVPTSKAAVELARERGIDVPIMEQVVAVLFEGKQPRKALLDLLARDPRRE